MACQDSGVRSQDRNDIESPEMGHRLHLEGPWLPEEFKTEAYGVYYVRYFAWSVVSGLGGGYGYVWTGTLRLSRICVFESAVRRTGDEGNTCTLCEEIVCTSHEVNSTYNNISSHF